MVLKRILATYIHTSNLKRDGKRQENYLIEISNVSVYENKDTSGSRTQSKQNTPDF